MNVIAICGVDSSNIAIQLAKEYNQVDNLQFQSCIVSCGDLKQLRINRSVTICMFTDNCLKHTNESYWNIYYTKSGIHMHSIRHIIRMLIK
jgi:hypothetical protein